MRTVTLKGLLILSFLSIVFASKMVCVDTGSCVRCTAEDGIVDYCKETNRKMKITCKDEDSTVQDYRSCSSTSDEEQLRLVIFQVIMAVVGGLAYWGVQVRKTHSLSLFDNRKLRYNLICVSCD